MLLFIVSKPILLRKKETAYRWIPIQRRGTCKLQINFIRLERLKKE